ncbi:MAG: hypothetical protein QOI72_1317, partial [Solirubrobacterales bacterium]|nr:hypothetical protein [Solirubrobacterales bacterium]
MVAALGSIWVANQLDETVTRLDAATGQAEATIPVGHGPNGLAATTDVLWVANELGDSVATIDPDTNEVSRTIPIGGTAASLAANGETVWLAVGASVREHRGGTLVISSTDPAPASIDPALAYDAETWRILTSTNDGLLAFKKVGGPDGATLVPDLASALPEVSPDGLTYRVPLREGMVYSTGEPIRPEDFRHAIERSLVLHQAASLLTTIEGATACTAENPTECDLSESIVVDESSVTFHLTTPDPELPFKLAMPFTYPVPMDIPPVDQLLEPVPATGPYVVTEAGPEGVEVARNEAFREWSAAAQPDGAVDRISWRFAQRVTDAYPQLTSGDVDVMISPPAPPDLAELRSAHPDRIIASPTPWTLFIGFDTQKPPFDDERARQAVNFAIDREHVTELLGGPTIERTTCQIFPPNFQGYAPFCPFTVDPESGVWSAPDPGRARQLMDEAGVAGTKIDVLTTDVLFGPPHSALETMRYVTEVLKDLGFEPKLEFVRNPTAYFQRINPPAGGAPGTEAGTPRHPHVFMSPWAADFPAANNFITPQFACGDAGSANVFGWCDKALDERVQRALLLNSTDPGAANREW